MTPRSLPIRLFFASTDSSLPLTSVVDVDVVDVVVDVVVVVAVDVLLFMLLRSTSSVAT